MYIDGDGCVSTGNANRMLDSEHAECQRVLGAAESSIPQTSSVLPSHGKLLSV